MYKTVTHHGIRFNSSALEKFCLNNGIKKLSLFGSVLRDDFGHESDIDFLVEFLPEERVGFFRLFDIMEELSSLVGGRKIDLRTPGDISNTFLAKVLEESEVQFER